MFGQSWERYIVENADQTAGSGGSWLATLQSSQSVENSPLPSASASLSTWSKFATEGSLGSNVGPLLESQYRATARLYAGIGRSYGWPRGQWLDVFDGVARAGSMNRWAEFDFSKIITRDEILSNQGLGGIVASMLGGQWSQQTEIEQLKLLISASLNVVDLAVYAALPAAGPVVDLATDVLELAFISQLGDETTPDYCDTQKEAATLSAEADIRVANKILDLVNAQGGSAPDLTDLFCAPGDSMTGFKLKFEPGTVMASSDACGGGVGPANADPDRLGFIPGIGIHQGLQATGKNISFYGAGPWTEVGHFMPTGNALMSRLWNAMQQSGPLMFSINALQAQNTWSAYLLSCFELVRNGYDTGSNMQWRASIWDSFAAYLGFDSFDAVWGNCTLQQYYGFRDADDRPVDLDAVAWSSRPITELGKLKSKQQATLDSEWSAYIDFSYRGVQGLANGASRWWDQVNSLISAPSYVLRQLDAQNIPFSQLRGKVERSGDFYAQSGQSKPLLPNLDLAQPPKKKPVSQIYKEQKLGISSGSASNKTGMPVPAIVAGIALLLAIRQ